MRDYQLQEYPESDIQGLPQYTNLSPSFMSSSKIHRPTLSNGIKVSDFYEKWFLLYLSLSGCEWFFRLNMNTNIFKTIYQLFSKKSQILPTSVTFLAIPLSQNKWSGQQSNLCIRISSRNQNNFGAISIIVFENPLIPLVAGNPCEQRSIHPPSRSPCESDNCPDNYDDEHYDDDGDHKYLLSNLTNYTASSKDMIMTRTIMNIIVVITNFQSKYFLADFLLSRQQILVFNKYFQNEGGGSIC